MTHAICDMAGAPPIMHLNLHIVSLRCAHCTVLTMSKSVMHFRAYYNFMSNVLCRRRADQRMDRKWACEVEPCNKKFSAASSLARHRREAHGNVLYKCEICNRDFRRKSYLKSHISVKHQKARHECQACGKGYTIPKTLKEHVRYAHEKRTFKCKVSI